LQNRGFDEKGKIGVKRIERINLLESFSQILLVKGEKWG